MRQLRGFYIHLAQYLVVTLGLLVLNLVVSPHRMWVFWVMGGWGIGILAHGLRVFRPDLPFGPQWERRQVEKRLGRPL